MKNLLVFTTIFFSMASLAQQKVVKRLQITEKAVSFSSDTNRSAMAINDSIPGPTLKFKEGDFAEIHVTNTMNVETSIHWHGLILPNYQDGVPYLNSPPIAPGKTHIFEFPLKHSGTYWYHSHTGLQEQLGVYGAIIVEPKQKTIPYDHDLALVLSDWTNENPNEVLRTLKRGSEWYSIKRKTAVSISEAISNGALGGLFTLWKMRMPGVDISDVYYNAFLINGKKHQKYSQFKPGDRVRVRVVNAGASTYFWTTFGGNAPKMISADGIDVAPVETPKVLHAIAETYDYIVTLPKNGKAIEIKAWAQDGSGSASVVLGAGEVLTAPVVPPPNYIEKTKMLGSMKMGMSGKSHAKMSMSQGDHSMHNMMKQSRANMKSQFSYDSLKSLESTTLDTSKPVRKVELNLTGNMWRYVWSMNGKTLSEVDKIKIKRGEVVRITLNNKTMMHHPMHLHGHFFRVLNKNGAYSPLKHTVDVEPMKSVTIEFDAVETGDWFFHCHVLYHMKGGMARVFSYGDKRDERMKPFALSNVLEADSHWYTWTQFIGASHFGSMDITSSNTRNQLNLGAQYGWNQNLEADASYERYISDYFRLYLGANSENKIEDSVDDIETVGVFGAKWLLPYFIDSGLRIDSDLKVQFSLGTEKLIFPRTNAFFYWEVTSDFGWKNDLPQGISSQQDYVWNVGLEYVVSRDLSLLASYENRFGAGLGLLYFW